MSNTYKITNIRRGYATNSSSSHSVILVNKRKTPDFICTPGEYGWNAFELYGEKEKREYFFTAFLVSMNRHSSDEKVKFRISEILAGIENAENSFKDLDSIYIDHQSFPLNVYHHAHKAAEEAFYLSNEELHLLDKGTELYKKIRNSNLALYVDLICCSPDFAILGGNDNSPEYIYEKVEKVGFEFIGTHDLMDLFERSSIRYDYSNDAYVIFDRKTGNKVRLAKTFYEKAFYPELVDIKITDYCPFGCSFCYQASTKKGIHASLETIEKYANILADMGVFEVALGGGEPTMHPNFVEILEIFREKNIVPNFTTFSVEWLKDRDRAKKILDLAGNFGVSVHNLKSLEKYTKIFETAQELRTKDYYETPRPMVQHVVGTIPAEELAQLVISCYRNNYPMLLLGFKDVGFGKDYEPKIKNAEEVSNLLYLLFSDIFSEKFEYYERKYHLSFLNTMIDKDPSFCNIKFNDPHFYQDDLSEFQGTIERAKHYVEMREKNKVHLPKREEGINFSVSVDTAFVNIFSDFLAKLAVPSYLYDTKEGKFSMYIDAVDNLIAPSSYIPKSEMIPVKEISKNFVANHWKEW